MFVNSIEENISEIFYLLNFFAKTRVQQYELVPNSFTPVWVEIGPFHCNVYNPICLLSGMLIASIESMTRNCGFSHQTIEILENEIGPLLDCWITEYDRSIFEIEEVSDRSKIWLVLSRLCKIALSLEDWSKYQINELSFEYFIEKYTYPYDPI